MQQDKKRNKTTRITTGKRPHLQYWTPQHKNGMKLLEIVQRATKIIKGLDVLSHEEEMMTDTYKFLK